MSVAGLLEVPAFNRAGETFAFGNASDGDFVAKLKRVDGDNVAEFKAVNIVATELFKNFRVDIVPSLLTWPETDLLRFLPLPNPS